MAIKYPFGEADFLQRDIQTDNPVLKINNQLSIFELQVSEQNIVLSIDKDSDIDAGATLIVKVVGADMNIELSEGFAPQYINAFEEVTLNFVYTGSTFWLLSTHEVPRSNPEPA